MSRQSLIQIGRLVMNQWFSFITGIFGYLAGVLALVPVNNRDTYFSSLIDSTSKLIQLMVVGLVLIVLWFLFCQWLGNKILTKGENTPHKVNVIPLTNSERKFEGNVIRYFAPLKLENKENVKITNCYAVIRKATPITSDKDITNTILGSTSKRLRWSDNQNNPNFEITIGAEKGEATLYVYQTAINLISNSPIVSDFCTNNPDIVRLGVAGRMNIYDVQIDFFGNVGTEELKLDSFVGRVETAIIQAEGEISCPLRVYSENIDDDIQNELSKKDSPETINRIVFPPESKNIKQIHPIETIVRNVSTPSEYALPTREQLIHKINHDTEEFEKCFKSIVMGMAKDRPDKYLKAEEFLQLLSGHRSYAKTILKNTNIYFLLTELEHKYSEFKWKITHYSQLKDERDTYMRAQIKVDKVLIDDIQSMERSLDKVIGEVHSYIDQVNEFCTKD